MSLQEQSCRKIISVLSSIDWSKVNPYPEIDHPLKVAVQLLEEGAKRENAMLISTGMFSNAVSESSRDVVSVAKLSTCLLRAWRACLVMSSIMINNRV